MPTAVIGFVVIWRNVTAGYELIDHLWQIAAQATKYLQATNPFLQTDRRERPDPKPAIAGYCQFRYWSSFDPGLCCFALTVLLELFHKVTGATSENASARRASKQAAEICEPACAAACQAAEPARQILDQCISCGLVKDWIALAPKPSANDEVSPVRRIRISVRHSPSACL
ncbi:hypothetical protein ASG68_24785 [Rhizobium sp. Leaf453]|nr:hypothetical protein ASG42_29025 [Rhizobium sp. Leaf391]KQU05977.1 hypothetical protein ASG68_24785 [Rhizobium sp. Leaf453]